MGPDVRGLEGALGATVRGLVCFDAGTRALYATDASNYRHVPVGVVIPASVHDLVAAVTAAREYDVPVAMRGGGTSIAGQATGRGLVIDASRYLRRIESVDPAARLARVEPGVVLDDLRAAAAPHGLTFGPDPSTHSRCTIGGMVGNNACGAHSLSWGNTAGNVAELDILLYDGRRLTVGAGLDSLRPASTGGGRDRDPVGDGRDSGISDGDVEGLRDRLERFQREHLALLRTGLPQLPRRCSGYLLDWLLPEHGVHVARSLVGTEGTCAIVLGATLRLVEVPAARALLVLGYPGVLAAADVAPAVVAHGPLAVEGMERGLIAGIRNPPPELPAGDGWLYAEFGGGSVAEATAAARTAAADAGALAYTVVGEPVRQRALWQLREHGVGWATRLRLPGGSEVEAWPGWEDAAVPPERFAVYLRDFKALLADHGLGGATYGHFGEGCVHVRIDFDLLSLPGRARFREFVVAATDLVVAHGGVPSGEHGDGQARAELHERVFGRPVVDMFAAFKALWDPAGRLNPGVAVRPGRLDADLRVAGPAPEIARLAGLALEADGGDLARATRRCVGVAACRAEAGGVMCPSFRATHDDRHSTRGRARLLAEMLRGDLVTGGWRSPEVREALDLCLACKGCLSDCPVRVDMASYKAELLHHHYRHRPRPRAHYALGWLPLWLRLGVRMPGLVNGLLGTRLGARAAAALAGITAERPLPRLAPTSFLDAYGPRSAGAVDVASDHRVGGEGLGPDRHEYDLDGAEAFPDGGRGQPVLIWPDTFTTYFTPTVGAAAVAVLADAGLAARLPDRPVCCGLTYLSTGQLGLARRTLRRSLDAVEPALDDGIPVLGLEPSCTAALRRDALELLPGDPRAHRLSRSVQTLSELLTSYAPDWPPRSGSPAGPSAGETAEDTSSHPVPEARRKAVVQRHCHQYAVLGFDADIEVMRRAGLDPDVLDAGCCGLAGNFGYEHYDISMAIGELAVLPAVRATPEDTLVIADGFSCRLQIAHATDRRAIHLAEALAASLSAFKTS